MSIPISLSNTAFDFELGELILIDKPTSWTSFDVVNKLKSSLNIKKIGHAGTLDPMATGLLVICTGKKTKEIDSYQGQDKEYIFELELGKTTASYDSETEVLEQHDISALTYQLVDDALASFQGPQLQMPPAYSALKINGKRAYKMARKGEVVELKPREITIHELELVDVDFPFVRARMVCSKGTYVRSLIHDLGQKLGVGAYMTALRRSRIGNFHVDQAFDIQSFVNFVKEKRSL
ncbi:MAG: tRNA pseudouridine(55) synthase TruB [Cytophagales bacterium]|nr:tRNA pseudouridine(55) synthase TruB [Cytophagales bacterium]